MSTLAERTRSETRHRSLWLDAAPRTLRETETAIELREGRARHVRWAVVAALTFGIVCRVSQYAACTSLWHDECFVALNVLKKSFGELLGPLEWHEASPPGFLVVEKLVVGVLGRSEYALRLVPLLVGLAGMVAYTGLVRRLSDDRRVGLWAVLLAAASAKLVVQSNEVKHFTLDFLWAVLLTWSAVRIWREERPTAALGIWAALGAVGLWLSYASLFVFAGTSLVLGWRALLSWGGRARAMFVLGNALVAVSLGVLGGPIRAQLDAGLVGYWTKEFPDLSGVGALAGWFVRAVLKFFDYFWQPLGPALMLVFAIGAVGLWRTRRRPELWLLTVPVLLTLAASLVHRWPFGGNQHMVFAAPAVLLVAAEGLERLRRRLDRRWAWAGAAGVGLLLVPGVGEAAYRVVQPRERHEIRTMLEFVEQNRKPGDQFLVLCPAEVEFYAGRGIRGSVKPKAAARVWVLSARRGNQPIPVPRVVEELSQSRPLLQRVETYGAAAYLFGTGRKRGSTGLP